LLNGVLLTLIIASSTKTNYVWHYTHEEYDSVYSLNVTC
jgi:hypothetical protein